VRREPLRSRLRTSLLAAAVAVGALLVAPPATGAVDVSPPGANDWTCRPSADKPHPVVLVHGTFEDMLKNWSTLAPVLRSEGYCVFALNYGDNATGPIAESAAELGVFVDAVLRATGARKVDVVGHSQGGMMPRYWMRFLGGAKKVDDLVGIVPSNHGTQGLIVPAPGGLATTASGVDNPACPACQEQMAGSAFLQTLNEGGDTLRGPSYTVITTRYDEVVTPYHSQFLDGPARQVTNILIQDLCPLNPIEHDQTPNDPVVHQLVVHALAQDGPADPAFQPECLPVP
jgi:triacylglycerol esterase/lipase EstA (alpha/beta hydrolase family)